MTRISKAQARALGILPKRKSRPVRMSTAQWDARITPGGVWIQVPQLPPSLNVWSRWHWARRKQYLDQLTGDLLMLAQAMRLPKFERAKVQVVYYFPDRRRRDKDNYSGKHLLDALRYAGVIAEDNSEVLALPEPRFEVDPVRPRTEVFVWERKSEQT